jgi:putative resolvase
VTAQTLVTHVFRSVKRVYRGKTITLIVVEYTDRATRFGFCYLETLLERKGRHFELVNLAENDREDLLADLVSIIYAFAARLYRQRRAKRKTAAVDIQLHSEGGEEA